MQPDYLLLQIFTSVLSKKYIFNQEQLKISLSHKIKISSGDIYTNIVFLKIKKYFTS